MTLQTVYDNLADCSNDIQKVIELSSERLKRELAFLTMEEERCFKWNPDEAALKGIKRAIRLREIVGKINDLAGEISDIMEEDEYGH